MVQRIQKRSNKREDDEGGAKRGPLLMKKGGQAKPEAEAHPAPSLANSYLAIVHFPFEQCLSKLMGIQIT